MSTTEGPRRVITARLATQDAFEPFGTVLEPRGEPLAHVYGDSMDVYDLGLHECDADTELIVSRYRYRGTRVQYLERHRQITQCFIPLGGKPLLAVVARPDAPLENGVPALDEIHAFVIPGDKAVRLNRGTWHEVPIPLEDDTCSIVTSHHGVTTGWGHLDESGEIDKGQTDEEKRDVTERTGVVLEVDVPASLLEGGTR